MTDVIGHYVGSEKLSVAVKMFETSVVDSTGWPLYLVRTVLTLFSLLGLVSGIQVMSENGDTSKTSESTRGKRNASKRYPEDSISEKSSFFWFQVQYLSVYLIVMLADWLQGPNMYTLYTSYGVDVGTLFITGFLSSAIFGTFVGVYVDTWGRKLGCVVFCVLEIIINLLEHVPNFTTLMIGRIMGGISTSLLFSAFESWMVSEHRKRGYKEEWLRHTFALASSGNGVVAIVAGLIAQVSADIAGDIGPFQVAIALTVLALILVLGWEENYGDSGTVSEKIVQKERPGQSPDGRKRRRSDSQVKGKNGSQSDNDTSFSTFDTNYVAMSSNFASLYASIGRAFQVGWSSPSILCLGCSQAVFEGAVYTFVFMWVKVLGVLLNGSSVHTGLVMTCFMLSMTIGGSASSLLVPCLPGGAHMLCICVYLLAACAMAVPIISFSFYPVFIAFLVLEATVGVFNSCGGTLRSQYYPEAQQSAMMTVFRVPLNALVVLGTHLSDLAEDEASLKRVFMCIVLLHLSATALQIALQKCKVAEKKKL